ncbi:FUSC family protein [Flavobacterium caeni]|uniref:TIGR01666 family membrane protein n=1 Tax=Flavobacterium caeni TaxID=490189 RepID=A0A1G5AXH1_9FLAO|nr:FUSC family membrane protein [Flavobacterium caeni]SCX82544.1 TIGR01666 family membrane protein [Flavobacterium caeni]
MIDRLRNFADSTPFTNALKVTVASVVPVLTLSYFDRFDVGFTIALGAFLTYPSDIPSNLRHKIKGVLVAALIVAGSNLLVNVLHPYPWALYPVVTAAIFFLSMIGIYGHRANMVSFSGLLALALAFGHLQQGWDILIHAGLMFVGGLFYLLVSLCFQFLSPHRYTELQLAECIKLTAKYLKLRGDLWHVEANRAKIIEKQLHLQVELNAIHENIREILIRNRPDSGSSNQHRKMLLVFISLVDVMELALSTSFDHSKLHQKFSAHPKVLTTYQQIAYNLGATLKQLQKSIANHQKYVSKHQLFKDLELLERVIAEYNDNTHDAEGVWMLTNMLYYVEKQVEKISVIERAFLQAVSSQDFKGRDRELEKFLAPQYYPWRTFRENLTFSSMHFRHALRLTITILIGFAIGALLPLQNVYWILLTVIVIMRPGYGLTKERSWQRIFGTVLGGLIAFALLSFIHNPVAIGVFTVIALILGFTYTATNYKIGATFVTIYVVFVYGLLTPDIEHVIQFRIVDTLAGAGLAFVANYFFWPSWEFLNVRVHLKKSIEANRDYLIQISKFYNEKGQVTTDYRLARKNAFVEIGNLMASFQRMSQEPRSKQRALPQLYKLVVLNHTLLSSSASLGTYIQSHKTTSASEAFNVVVAGVIRNLNRATALLDGQTETESPANEEVALRFTELKNLREKELKQAHLYGAQALELKMQEAQLVIEQLIWLTNLSENIVGTSARISKI